eukprot:1190404-Pyramimonas_sp.AAC.1
MTNSGTPSSPRCWHRCRYSVIGLTPASRTQSEANISARKSANCCGEASVDEACRLLRAGRKRIADPSLGTP